MHATNLTLLAENRQRQQATPPYFKGHANTIINITPRSICPFYTYFYSTGSYPPLLNGLHLHILLTANHPPFKTPYFSIASIE